MTSSILQCDTRSPEPHRLAHLQVDAGACEQLLAASRFTESSGHRMSSYAGGQKPR